MESSHHPIVRYDASRKWKKKSPKEDVKAAIFNDFNMNDFIGGAPDRDAASSLVHRLNAALKIHEVELQKWTSMNPA